MFPRLPRTFRLWMTPLIPVLNENKRWFVLTLLCTYQPYCYKEIVLKFPRVKWQQMPVSVCINVMSLFDPKAKATFCNIFTRLQRNSQKGNPKVLKWNPKKLQKRLQRPATKTVWIDFVAQNSAKKCSKRHSDIFECFCVRTFERFKKFECFFLQNKEYWNFLWLHYKNFQTTAILQLHCSRAKKIISVALALALETCVLYFFR